jgi:hypothetical protein
MEKLSFSAGYLVRLPCEEKLRQVSLEKVG